MAANIDGKQTLSGAFSPGLIEVTTPENRVQAVASYPGHSAPASLKSAAVGVSRDAVKKVIRGIQPRPH